MCGKRLKLLNHCLQVEYIANRKKLEKFVKKCEEIDPMNLISLTATNVEWKYLFKPKPNVLARVYTVQCAPNIQQTAHHSQTIIKSEVPQKDCTNCRRILIAHS